MGFPRAGMAHPLADDISDDIHRGEIHTGRMSYRSGVGVVAVDTYATTLAQLVANSAYAVHGVVDGKCQPLPCVWRIHPGGLFLPSIQLPR